MFLRNLFIALLFISGVIGTVKAQNLIPDPGFEIWDGTIGPNPNTMGGLDFWFNVNGTTDHHHQLNPPGSNLTSLEDCPTGQGSTWCGVPYEGQGVLGAWKGNGPDGTREWAGVELSEPMVAGGCYEISFWIQNKRDKPDQPLVTNQWGMFFNHTQTPFFNPNLANYAAMSDHWVACEQVIDGSEWIKVEWEYQASEDFAYAYIGFMGDFSTSSNNIYNDSYLLGPYVWIDEVIITRIDPQLTLTEDVSICLGESVTLEASSNFPINWEDTDTGVSSRTVSPEETTTYYVQTLDSTLCSIRDSIVVTVLGNEVIEFEGVSICDGADPVFLAPDITSGTWSGSGIIEESEGLFDPVIAGVGEHAITYNSGADCSENFTMLVEVVDPPEINFAADFTEGCPPLNVQFTDNSEVTGMDFIWDFGNGLVSTDPHTTATVYHEVGAYDVSLEVVYSENCKNKLTVPNFIEVFDPPVANFTNSPFNPSNLSPEVQFFDASTGNLMGWFWDFGNGETSDKNNATTSYDLPGIYDVQLNITSVNGCVDSIYRQIMVNSIVNFYIPNVFSPNYDGVNDLFEVYTVGPLREYKMTVFNRWGGIVYQSTDINAPWDGDLPNGDKADVGVYTYSIEYNYAGLLPNESFSGVEMGDVMLMR